MTRVAFPCTSPTSRSICASAILKDCFMARFGLRSRWKLYCFTTQRRLPRATAFLPRAGVFLALADLAIGFVALAATRRVAPEPGLPFADRAATFARDPFTPLPVAATLDAVRLGNSLCTALAGAATRTTEPPAAFAARARRPLSRSFIAEPKSAGDFTVLTPAA